MASNGIGYPFSLSHSPPPRLRRVSYACWGYPKPQTKYAGAVCRTRLTAWLFAPACNNVKKSGGADHFDNIKMPTSRKGLSYSPLSATEFSLILRFVPSHHDLAQKYGTKFEAISEAGTGIQEGFKRLILAVPPCPGLIRT